MIVELSIIIVNWNTKEFLRNCLNSIYENLPPFSLEIIVVDNASSDGSQDMVKKEFPEVILIENSLNLGYSKANNIGFKLSKGRYILFLNSDTIVHRDTLSKALDFMKLYDDAGVMGCKTLNSDGSLQYSAFNFPSPIRIFAYITGLNRLFKISRFKNFSKVRLIDYVQGSFLLTRRDILESIGGFDENFFMYNEDVDLCKRLWNLGFKVYYNPDISITHYLGGSSKKNPEVLKKYIESSIYLYRKHKKSLDVFILKVVIFKAVLIKITLHILTSFLKLKFPDFKYLKFLRSCWKVL
jgi:GT2 family glycosyltransferase